MRKGADRLPHSAVGMAISDPKVGVREGIPGSIERGLDPSLALIVHYEDQRVGADQIDNVR